MPKAKQAFGVCCINNHIYVVGGYQGKMTSSCERYDILSDSWEAIPSIPFETYSLSLTIVDKRFIVAFGLNSDNFMTVNKQFEHLLCLDTFNLTKGWTHA